MRCPHGVAGGAGLERLENRGVLNPDRRTGAFLGASSWLALLDLRSPPKNSCARAPVFWDSFPETEPFPKLAGLGGWGEGIRTRIRQTTSGLFAMPQLASC